MSLLDLVVKELGVEYGEKFKIAYDSENLLDGEFYFCKNTDFKCFCCSKNNNETSTVGCIVCTETVLTKLLTGAYEIKKEPYKPNLGDYFYSIGIDGEIGCSIWDGDMIDLLFYKAGNCFRNEKEAEQNKDKILNMLDSDKQFEY